jgi:hypothetical protein
MRALDEPPGPTFAIPGIVEKPRTRTAGRPMSGVFEANAALAWTGLPTAEFRANLAHIAKKRIKKADPAFRDKRGLPPPVADLSTPEKVEAHVREVLEAPSFAQVRWRDGVPFSLSIIKLGTEGVDQLVGISLSRSDGHGRLDIATAFPVAREDTIRRFAAALNRNGTDAIKMRKTREGLDEILQLVVQVPPDSRGPSWHSLNASLARDQAALSIKRALVTEDGANRSEARKRLAAGRTVFVGSYVQDGLLDVVRDVADVVPQGIRVGVLDRIEPIRVRGGEAQVRAHYRTTDGRTFTLLGAAGDFTDGGAFYEPAERAIALNFFGRPAPARKGALGDLFEGVAVEQLGKGAAPGGVSFETTIRGLLFHEIIHAYWPVLDDWVRELLLGHAERLGVLGRNHVEFTRLTRWEPFRPRGDASDSITIRESYIARGADADILEQEAVAHMIQLAAVGALKADDLAQADDLPSAVDVLKALFDGDKQHMTKALTTPAPGAPRRFALEPPPQRARQPARRPTPRTPDPQAEERRVLAKGRLLVETRRLREERAAAQVDPASRELADAERGRELKEILEACRS